MVPIGRCQPWTCWSAPPRRTMPWWCCMTTATSPPPHAICPIFGNAPSTTRHPLQVERLAQRRAGGGLAQLGQAEKLLGSAEQGVMAGRKCPAEACRGGLGDGSQDGSQQGSRPDG